MNSLSCCRIFSQSSDWASEFSDELPCYVFTDCVTFVTFVHTVATSSPGVSRYLQVPPGTSRFLQVPSGISRYLQVLPGAQRYLHWLRHICTHCVHLQSRFLPEQKFIHLSSTPFSSLSCHLVSSSSPKLTDQDLSGSLVATSGLLILDQKID